jgi:L-alanine-DL-glutamate epimerase-like enolase superfamily enzyme
MAVAAPTAGEVGVEDLRVSAFTVPTDAPESDGTLEWDSTTIVVAEVSARGETGLGYTYGEVAVAELISSKLGDAVAGADAMSPPAAWARMHRALRNAGQQGAGAMAVSAVDIALWDLKARLLGLPLADALPRVHDSVPVYGSGGFTSYDDGRLREQLAGWVLDGIPRVKIKVGRDPDRDPHRLAVAREAIGEETELMVDANGAFDRAEAARWAERYADEFAVTWFEEPVSSWDREGLRLLRDRAPAGLAIAAGEYEWDLWGLAAAAGCVHVLQADVTRCGGITNLLRADGIALAARVPLSAHCAPGVSAHACSAVQSLRHLEYFHDHVRLEQMLFDGVIEPEDGALRPDRTRPGLGLELKRSEAERFAA